MCIFCGGTCDGAGDVILPTLAAGAGMVMLRIQAKRELKKGKTKKDSTKNQNDKVTAK
jgi:hypothetical protein